MPDLPPRISEWLLLLVKSQRCVAHLLIDSELVLIDAGGELERYGLADLKHQHSAADQSDVSCHLVRRLYSCNSAPDPTATTKYWAGVVPTFLIPCSSFEATKPTEPGSKRKFLPLTVSSIVPSRMSHISEWG